MRREMARAAAIGVELFVIDAGWYAGADTHDTSDFEAGLGTWTPDPKRFPSGLKALTDYAHSLGLEVRRLGRARACGSLDRRARTVPMNRRSPRPTAATSRRRPRWSAWRARRAGSGC